MNIIVIGKTNIGKTPLVEFINKNIKESKIIPASGWIKELYTRPEGLTKEMYVKDISKKSIEYLKLNKDVDYNYLIKHSTSKINIIDGIRNPYTFEKILNPQEDIIFLIKKSKNTKEFSEFDKGVDVIEHIIGWMVDVELLSKTKIFYINYEKNILKEKNIKLMLDSNKGIV